MHPAASSDLAPAWRFLAIAALWALAVAHPGLDLVGRQAEFLVAHQLNGALLVGFAVLVCWGPALVLALPALLPGRLGGAVFRLTLAVLMTAFALRLLAPAALPGWLVAALALGAGMGLATWVRHSAVCVFLQLLTPAILGVPAFFLLRADVRDLLADPLATDPAILQATAPTSDTPIVLVIFDELPLSTLLTAEGEINAHRFPAFADLAATAHDFRNAATAATGTAYAVPAILTGRAPDQRRLPTARHYPQNLLTWLGGSYRLHVLESLTRLCPETLCTELGVPSATARLTDALRDLAVVDLHLLLPPDLATTIELPPIDTTWSSFGNPGRATPPRTRQHDPRTRRGDAAGLFARFLSTLEPAGGSTLHLLHLQLPHVPWRYLPSGKTYTGSATRLRPRGLRGKTWRRDPRPTVDALQRHLLQTRYADRLLGELLGALRAADAFDPALVIVTADHGASFRPGTPRREPDIEAPADVVLVPLLVKRPFQRHGAVEGRPVSTLDLVPTIADALEATLPWTSDGHSLLTTASAAAPLPTTNRRVALHDGYALTEHRTYGAEIPGVRRAAKRQRRLFGDGSDPDDLYRLGPHGDLVGRSLAELEIVHDPASPLAAELADASHYGAVRLNGKSLPALAVARLEGATPPLEIAVALHGTVRATTTSYLEDTHHEVMAMLPEAAFREGENPVRIFQIEKPPEPGGEPRLHLFRQRQAATWRLEQAGAQTVLRSSEGQTLTIKPGSLDGEASSNGTALVGWAGDAERGTPAERVLVFLDGTYFAALETGALRAEVAQRLKRPGLERSGFQMLIPWNRLDHLERLALYAVLGEHATRLRLRQ